MGWYDRRTRRVRDLPCGDARIFLEIDVRRVRCKSCGQVKSERLDFLADNPFYTKRFAYYVGGDAVVRPRSRTLPRNSGFTGRRSRLWRCGTCGRSWPRRAHPVPR